MNELHLGNCLEVLPTLGVGSVDCVITDPPYGTTACKWDSVIPFEPMWKELKRIAKPKAAICLFGSQPFTSALVMSNPKMFRYEWIWEKNMTSGFVMAKKQPMRNHENIAVFYAEPPAYNYEKEPRDLNEQSRKRMAYEFTTTCGENRINGGLLKVAFIPESKTHRYPTTVKKFKSVPTSSGRLHPTQKPVELLRYLIRTYTQEGETVLDFTMGSGSTGVACVLEGRNFIGIEKDENYFQIAKERIEATLMQPSFFDCQLFGNDDLTQNKIIVKP